MTKEKIKVPSLRRRSNRKQPDWKNTRQIAIVLRAEDLSLNDQGGGIVDILLESHTIDQATLDKARRDCNVVEIAPRKRTVDRGARACAESDDVIYRLAIWFEQERGSSPKAVSAAVREFSIWVSEQAKNPDSNVARLFDEVNPDLIGRSASWWEERMAERRKTLKTES